jgi:hypothetical protein
MLNLFFFLLLTIKGYNSKWMRSQISRDYELLDLNSQIRFYSYFTMFDNSKRHFIFCKLRTFFKTIQKKYAWHLCFSFVVNIVHLFFSGRNLDTFVFTTFSRFYFKSWIFQLYYFMYDKNDNKHDFQVKIMQTKLLFYDNFYFRQKSYRNKGPKSQKRN